MNLKESILKTIAFFDIVDFPLTAEEILRHLYGHDKPVHIKEIKGLLAQMMMDGQLEMIRDHYVLKGRGRLIDIRKSRKFIAEKWWARTRFYLKTMQSVPFVRMIAVCNNLAFNNTSDESDIDLLIVVEKGHMWTARFLLTLALQFFGVRRHGRHVAGRFCLSFFLSTQALNLQAMQIRPEDPYLAYWVQTLAPVYGIAAYRRFKELNAPWLKHLYQLDFLSDRELPLMKEPRPFLKRLLEWLLGGFLGRGFEGLLMATFKKRTVARSKSLGADASVVITDDMLKFHNHDRREEYRGRWLEKWQKATPESEPAASTSETE